MRWPSHTTAKLCGPPGADGVASWTAKRPSAPTRARPEAPHEAVTATTVSAVAVPRTVTALPTGTTMWSLNKRASASGWRGQPKRRATWPAWPAAQTLPSRPTAQAWYPIGVTDAPSARHCVVPCEPTASAVSSSSHATADRKPPNPSTAVHVRPPSVVCAAPPTVGSA